LQTNSSPTSNPPAGVSPNTTSTEKKPSENNKEIKVLPTLSEKKPDDKKDLILETKEKKE